MRHAPHLIRSKAVAEPAAVLLREVQIIIYNRKIGDKNVVSAILRHIVRRVCAHFQAAASSGSTGSARCTSRLQTPHFNV